MAYIFPLKIIHKTRQNYLYNYYWQCNDDNMIHRRPLDYVLHVKSKTNLI